MKKLLTAVFFMTTAAIVLNSCDKNCDGCPDAQGGQLPTIYINIEDNAFSPANVSAANGRSFTFVNNTGSVKGIYSSDSIVINKPSIPTTSSFVFKKDTVGTIVYKMAGKPSVTGTITITP